MATVIKMFIQTKKVLFMRRLLLHFNAIYANIGSSTGTCNFTASINSFHRSSRCATIALSGSRHILDMSISFSRNLYILNNGTNNFCLLFIADIQLNYLGSSIFCFRLLSLK